MTERGVDVAIVGGGIMGASLAWRLARRGAGRVALFERSVVASGASGKTGGLLRRHYSNRTEATLAQRGWRVYSDWPEIVGGDPVHTPAGLIVTVDTSPACPSNLDRLRRNVAMQNELGIPARVVSPAELADLQPFACWDDVAAAAYEPDSGYVDAVAATRGMALAARRAGADVREATPVLGVAVEGERVVGVRTRFGVVPAGAVVAAAGPWTNRVLAGTGVSLPIEALRVQVAVVHRPLALEAPHLVYLDTANGVFARAWGPGRTFLGVAAGEQHDVVDPDAYDQRSEPEHGERAIAALARRIPAMKDAVYLTGQTGLYDMTPDAHAIIGPAGPDGLFVMAGFSGAGFKKGPAVGEAMADLLLDGRCDWVDLAPFHLDRFADDSWRRPWSDTEYAFPADFGHGL
ncbi:MAG TPA: FAD-dependent oxidoreductase [Thermomicrobiales bacterium]|nr:FAD-dependent oxidoreductase [Thermomicrobiales bacterium]